MSRYLLGCTFAGALALTAGVAAQDPPTQTPPTQTPPATRTQPSQDQAKLVTVEGCLVREADVPGRKPNVAERAGISEDFILTSTKVIKGTAPSSAGVQAKPGEAPTGTSGMRASMYEVEGIDNDKLKEHVGQRVQIEGTFENLDRAAAASPEDLVQIRGTVIRKVAGECPAK